MGLSHRIERTTLEAGDHIYSWRPAYSYSHHGIFIGDDTVIHLTQDGVLSSSLDNFLRGGGKLRRYKYAARPASIIAKRGGTCTTAASDDSGTVVQRAKFLLENGFGCYKLLKKNCEHFAIYCKTGLLIMGDKEGTAGTSAQVASFKSMVDVTTVVVPTVCIMGVALAASPPPAAAAFVMIALPLVAGAEGVITYCGSRLGADIGVRKDVKKVDVEDLKEEAAKSYASECSKSNHDDHMHHHNMHDHIMHHQMHDHFMHHQMH